MCWVGESEHSAAVKLVSPRAVSKAARLDVATGVTAAAEWVFEKVEQMAKLSVVSMVEHSASCSVV